MHVEIMPNMSGVLQGRLSARCRSDSPLFEARQAAVHRWRQGLAVACVGESGR